MKQAIESKSFPWQSSEFRFQQMLTNVFVGVVSGMVEIAFSISLGSLIFSGDMAVYLPYGIAMGLLTSITMLIVTGLGSRIPGVMGGTQESTAVILGTMAAGLVAVIPAGQPVTRFQTILVAIAATTLLTGAAFLAVGYFKLGRLMRFFPYPVVGGFLAGTGWLLLQGSIGVMAGISLTIANLPVLFQPAQLVLWVPGLIFALVLFVAIKRIHHNLVLPVVLLGGLVVFYLLLAIRGLSTMEAIQQGLLLGEGAGQIAWKPLSLQTILAADWSAILMQSGTIGIVLFLSLVSLLLNASGLELAVQQDVDLNRELKTAGVANLISGALGGLVGFHTLGQSTLSYRMGARGRLPGVAAGLACAGIFLVSAHLLAYFPRSILGGLLLYMGLDFLYDWVIETWPRLPHSEYAIILLILVVIAATNFLVGVGVGLIAMVIMFAIDYSRVSVISHTFSGAELHSNVERWTFPRRALAEELGQQMYILELHGFIFFGTANVLLDRIRQRLNDTAHPPLRFMVIDFRRITGMDSSAAASFVKARQLAEGQSFTLVLTNLSPESQRLLAKGGLFKNGQEVLVFPDLDRGIEYGEEQLLAQAAVPHSTPLTLEEQLASNGLTSVAASRIRPYLERLELSSGDCLIRQGEPSNAIYFIESGVVSVYLDSGLKTARIRTLRLGTSVGELSFLLGILPTATVLAGSPAVAYRLTPQALERMQTQDPGLAIEFHKYLSCILSERIISTTRTLEAVMR